MSEQIYYVRLKPMDTYLIRDNPDKGGVIWIDGYKQPFTKSELAEINNGALYKVKQKPRNITIDQLISDGWDRLIGNDWEWINPLIELVPVEEETDV